MLTVSDTGLRAPASRHAFHCRCQQNPNAPQRPPSVPKQYKTNTPHSPVTPAGPQTPANSQSGFGSIERMIASNFNNVQPGLRGDWMEVEGNWILRPLRGPATAVVHFLGGAFVGAAPQLTYRLLLESLAARGVMVGTIPVPCLLHVATLAQPPTTFPLAPSCTFTGSIAHGIQQQ